MYDHSSRPTGRARLVVLVVVVEGTTVTTSMTTTVAANEAVVGPQVVAALRGRDTESGLHLGLCEIVGGTKLCVSRGR